MAEKPAFSVDLPSQESDLKNLKSLFSTPKRQSQPWAIWTWNMSVNLPEMERQLNDLISKGFGGIAVRPGRDMSPAYTSEEFFDLFEQVLKIAQQNKVGIRLADDFSMPWNNVFETITNQSKKLRSQCLVKEKEIISKGEEEHVIELDCESEYIALVMGISNSVVALEEARQISVPKGQSEFVWKSAGEDQCLLLLRKSYAHNLTGGFIPNPLNTKTAQLYISNVLDVFHDRFSKYMPGTFEGFINEMPACKPGSSSIPWDDDLVVKYRAKYKKDLIKLLPAIFFQTNTPCNRIRTQVYAFIFGSMYEKFALPLENWAKKYRLSQWVFVPETGIPRTDEMLSDMYIPTETGLGAVGFQNINGAEENYALLRTMADTNTNEFRRETLTVIGRNSSGHGATVQSLKKEIDQSLLNGPSTIIMDGFFFNYDQRNYMKTPHNVGWYSTEWEYLRYVCDYSAHTQEILAEMQSCRQIAVLSPCTSILSQFSPEDSQTAHEGLAQFRAAVDQLMSLNADVDIITEELLLSCTVRQNGEFGTNDRIRKGNYSMLVLPYAPLISRSVLVFLEKLIAKQGSILFIGQKTEGTYLDGFCSSIQARIEKLLSSKKGFARVVEVNEIMEAVPEIKTDISVVSSSGKPCPDIHTSAYLNEGAKLYVISNRNADQEQMCTVEVAKEKNFTLIDCAARELRELSPEESDNSCSFDLIIAPNQTLFIASSSSNMIPQGYKQNDSYIDPFALPQRSYRMVMKDAWMFRAKSMNALPLANWTTRMGLSRETGGVIHYHESIFEVRSLPENCFLVTAGPNPDTNTAEVSVNGAKKETVALSPEDQNSPHVREIRKLFGEKAAVYDIAEVVVKGFNRVSFRMSSVMSEPQSILYPPLVMGHFAIAKGSQGWALDKESDAAGQDSWAKHGYPYLTGMGEYSQSFEIPNEYKKLILRFSKVSGTVYAKVNGRDFGAFHWQPMEVDITSACEPKRNELEIRVVNSLDNVLRMNGRPSGLMGEVFIDVY
ncbi:glycoside hydrolase [Chitinispirillum alkaliphilum]|nr:glycoside hydrolase [Chitinispirillum alkaliphilum]